MKSLPKSYDYFLKALEHTKTKDGTGFQNRLSFKIGRSEGYISQLFNRKSIASFNLQNEISEACGYEYDEFLALGKTLIIGKENQSIDDSNVIHLDPAIQLLHEALEETGVEINDKQKQAVLKILRDELEKSEDKTKDDIKKYLQAFGN